MPRHNKKSKPGIELEIFKFAEECSITELSVFVTAVLSDD